MDGEKDFLRIINFLKEFKEKAPCVIDRPNFKNKFCREFECPLDIMFNFQNLDTSVKINVQLCGLLLKSADRWDNIKFLKKIERGR